MCTVTYLPTQKGYILTSSRDEYNLRTTMIPLPYQMYNQTITFPKDEKAGGTWIAASDSNRVACLLNGAFENFEHQDHYVISRGKILLDFFSYPDAKSFIEGIDCSQVAPFTLLMLQGSTDIKFTQFRWDGNRKFIKIIDPSKPTIWASATLYDIIQREERKIWFEKWLSNDVFLSSDKMKSFHTANHISDTSNNIVMKRDQGLQTVSVTQILSNQNSLLMHYHDFIQNSKFDLNIPLCDQVLS